MKRRIARTARAGFTLVEVLVTMVLIALLVSVVLPAVINQLGAGENTRIIEDNESVRSAGKMFRIDVKRWPSSLDQLVLQPDSWSTTPDINGAAITAGLRNRWNGPYLETGSINASTDSLHSAAGAAILPTIVDSTYNGARYWTLQVANLTGERMRAIDLEIDGVENLGEGRIRLADFGNDPTDSIMLYFTSPIN